MKFRGIKKVLFQRQRVKMNGVSKDAPIGIQCIERISNVCCPRLRINRLRWFQCLVLVLTYLTYMSYHVTRKPLSVVKSVLHQNCSELPRPPGAHSDTWCDWPPFNTTDANTLLGALDSSFLFTYAAAMFVSGMVAERVNLRYFLTLGMLFSAIFCYLFGIGRTYDIHNISYYILIQAGAGIAQTSGWPGTVAIVGRWFGNQKKGLIFGIWNSHTSLGNILGTLMAAEYVEKDWSLSFILPAVLMAGVAVLVFLLLPDSPRDVGVSVQPNRSTRRSESEEDDDQESEVIVGDQAASLRSNRYSSNAPPSEPSEHTSLLGSSRSSAISFSRALSIPGVIEFSLSLLFAKLVSYTFLYWLPMYIKYSSHMTAKQAGDLSTLFDVGGVLGAVLAGLLADRGGCPALVCAGFYTVAAPLLLLYVWCGGWGWWWGAALLGLSGAAVNGPYALITTAVSAELGTHSSLAGNSQALATVTAIIDGTGSIGAAIGPLMAGVVSSEGSWSHVFYMLITCNLVALVFLLRIVKTEIVKLRQERRLASPRVVRIE